MAFGISEEELKEIKDMYLGKEVEVEINDPWHPIYSKGVVKHVDDIGQLHGTWGSLAAIPGVDNIKIIN